MNRLILIIISFSISLNCLYSQRIKNPIPAKIKISDLETDSTKSSCLLYFSFLSFPFSCSEKTTGARDRFFKVKNETFMRILLNKHDTTSRFFVLNELNNTIPEIKNIVTYSIDLGKLVTKSVSGKDSVFLINYFDKGFYIDLSKLKDSTKNKVTDISFTNSVFSKDTLTFCIGSYLEYKYLCMKVDIPQIYKYKISYKNFFEYKGSKPYRGPFIGYGKIGTTPLMPKSIHDALHGRNKGNGTPEIPKNLDQPNYCYLISYIFTSKNLIVYQNENNVLTVIKLTLDKISEIPGTTWVLQD